MAQCGRDFGPDDLFAVRYVSRGRTSDFLLSVIDLMPSGRDMKIEAVFTSNDRETVQLRASEMIAVVHQQTGELIDDPVSWFRFAWLDRMVLQDGTIPLDAVINGLPIDGIWAGSKPPPRGGIRRLERLCVDDLRGER
jgi:hypothetical protein